MRQVNAKTAYILWCLQFFGLGGIQRFYTGHFCMGLFYLLTGGGFLVGQIIDLFLIPRMVERRNRYLAGSAGYNPQLLVTPPAKPRSPMQRLILAAKDHGGELSIAQAVLYTEMEPEEIQQVLLDAQRSGVAEIFNDPQTGAIRYRFDL
jgi:TM2 domain-containing membrane protein YozV